MELVNPTFFHLDLAFSVLPKNNFIVYLPAFSANTQRHLQNWWTDEGISVQNQVYFLNEREALSFQANIVFLPDKKGNSAGHILSPPLSSKLEKWLHARGFHTIQLDLSEFHKAGGSIHCILNQLITTNTI
jgi:N-dimethylarginine dimethylaminohydrolase